MQINLILNRIKYKVKIIIIIKFANLYSKNAIVSENHRKYGDYYY